MLSILKSHPLFAAIFHPQGGGVPISGTLPKFSIALILFVPYLDSAIPPSFPKTKGKLVVTNTQMARALGDGLPNEMVGFLLPQDPQSQPGAAIFTQAADNTVKG